MRDRKVFSCLLVAGGTGGHLFPAAALAQELLDRGWAVALATDERTTDLTDSFPTQNIYRIPSATPSVRNPIRLMKAVWKLGQGYIRSQRLLRQVRPDIVVGFGGYPTVPPLFAATSLGIKTVLHEQNGVLGRANKFLSDRVDAVALSLPLAKGDLKRSVVTGNPVRSIVLDAAKVPYPEHEQDGSFNLLVFGGSQGARFFTDLMMSVLQKLPDDLRKRLQLVQQTRPEDLERMTAHCEGVGIEATLAPFFDDLPRSIAESHLVICRSGASSVAELAVIGRPSFLVPLPGSLDNDQGVNARILADVGAADVMQQHTLDADLLVEKLKTSMNDREGLATKAQRAKDMGKPDAVNRLADLLQRVCEGDGKEIVPEDKDE